MVAGHTHEEMVRRLGRMTVINPGTLSRDHQSGFVLVDFSGAIAQFFHFEGASITPSPPINLIDLDTFEA
jgi:Icc-related predicted phosphoesterase